MVNGYPQNCAMGILSQPASLLECRLSKEIAEIRTFSTVHVSSDEKLGSYIISIT